jgi:hypothetical protein
MYYKTQHQRKSAELLVGTSVSVPVRSIRCIHIHNRCQKDSYDPGMSRMRSNLKFHPLRMGTKALHCRRRDVELQSVEQTTQTYTFGLSLSLFVREIRTSTRPRTPGRPEPGTGSKWMERECQCIWRSPQDRANSMSGFA